MKRSIAMLTVTLLLLPTVAARAEFKVTCESFGHDHHYCPVDTSGGVVLDHQLSHAGCWQNDTWGYDSKGVWVSNGCQAEFVVGQRSQSRGTSSGASHSDGKSGDKAGAIIGGLLAAGVIAAIASKADDSHDHGSGGSSRSSWSSDGRLVTCESYGGRYQYCSAGWSQHVELHRQLSRDACNYNRTWGYDRNGIWVSGNCRAEFMIDGHNDNWGWSQASSSNRGLTLYRDLNYTGRSEVFSRDAGSLTGSSIGNDQATSARVSRGCRARLYQHENFQGNHTEISGGLPDLRGSRVGDDSISSIQVRCN